MPHPLSFLAAAVAAPLLGLAVHAAPHAAGDAATRAAAGLPHNLCSSCHGGGSVVSPEASALSAHEMSVSLGYLRDVPRG